MPLTGLSCDFLIWVSLGKGQVCGIKPLLVPCSRHQRCSSTGRPVPVFREGDIRGTLPRDAAGEEFARQRESQWEEEAEGRGRRKCKGPEVGPCLVYSRRDKEVSVAQGSKAGWRWEMGWARWAGAHQSGVCVLL